MLLEKTISGTNMGESGIMDFEEEVKNSMKGIKDSGNEVTDISYSSKPCGCKPGCSVVRYWATLHYQKRVVKLSDY
jgi:hypothetical protein